MADEDLLTEAALGDRVALLQGPALALTSGPGIRKDEPLPPPNRTPVPGPTPLDPTVRDKSLRWNAGKAISVQVRAGGSALGYAMLDGSRQLLSREVILQANSGSGQQFGLVVSFHVDFTNMPRPLPFEAPHVGVAWKFQTDAGVVTVPYTHIDDYSPQYITAGASLRTAFDGTILVSGTSSGWLHISGRIEDQAGSVEYDDVIRCVVVGIPI